MSNLDYNLLCTLSWYCSCSIKQDIYLKTRHIPCLADAIHSHAHALLILNMLFFEVLYNYVLYYSVSFVSKLEDDLADT